MSLISKEIWAKMQASANKGKGRTWYDEANGKVYRYYRSPLHAWQSGYNRGGPAGDRPRPGWWVKWGTSNIDGGTWTAEDWDPEPQRERARALTEPNKALSTYSLNAGQRLASLGESIPILFGRYTGSSGGFVTAPSAVYQRMHSAGVYEWCRTAYVIGEGGVVLYAADSRGVRTGTTTLTSGNQQFWSYLFTDGSSSNNNPTLSNTLSFGQFKAYEPGADVTAAGELLTGTINGAEVQCFSQSFESGEVFGFSGEEQECNQESDDGEIEAGQIQPLNLNVVRATVSNTRPVKVTEIGLTVNLQTVGSDKNAVAPAGSLWVQTTYDVPLNESWTTHPRSLTAFVYRVQSIGQRLANTLSFYHRNNLDFKLENSATFARYQKEWEEGTRTLERLDPETLRPLSPGSTVLAQAMKVREFTEKIGTRYFPFTGENRNRMSTPATGFAMPSPNSCAPPDYLSILSDGSNPKMMFRIFWRPFSSTSNDWRELTRTPLIAACVDATVMFTTLKIQHPTESAVEYRFEPVTPDEFAREFMQYDEFLLEEGYEYIAESDGEFPIIYDRNSSPVRLNLNDGFELEFLGGYSNFYGNVDLDANTTNYSVGISYVNEILQDRPDFPFMATSVLNVRGYKGVSTQGQLSVYYDNGADIRLLENGNTTSSNLFPELANYLLTTFPGGSAGAVPATAIDTPSFLEAINFTRGKGLFYDGVIENRTGAFEFIADNAKFFLLRFGMKQGLYSFFNATEDSGGSGSTASPSQVLTVNDIIADSFSVEYATLRAREPAFINITYRHQERYLPGQPTTVTVAPKTYTGSNILSYDLSDFCTSERHAATYGKFALASRLSITHKVRFTTFLDRIDLTPGKLFKFDLTVETSAGQTYTNTDQYQIITATYGPAGTVSVLAAYMPIDFSTLVFGDTYRITK